MQTPEGVMTMSFVRDMTKQRAAMEMVRRQDLAYGCATVLEWAFIR